MTALIEMEVPFTGVCASICPVNDPTCPPNILNRILQAESDNIHPDMLFQTGHMKFLGLDVKVCPLISTV